MVEENGCLEVLVPCHHFVLSQLRGWFRRAEAIETIRSRQSVPKDSAVGNPYFDICCVDTLIPLHNKIIRPVSATATRNLVRVKNIIMAFQGGNLDLADFQVTPPLGKSILKKYDLTAQGESKQVGIE